MCKPTVTSQVALLQSALSFLVPFEIRVVLQSDYCRHKKAMCTHTVRPQVHLLQSLESFMLLTEETKALGSSLIFSTAGRAIALRATAASDAMDLRWQL